MKIAKFQNPSKMEKPLEIRQERQLQKKQPNLLNSKYFRFNYQGRQLLKRLTGGLNSRLAVRSNLRELPPYGLIIRLSWPIKIALITTLIIFCFIYGSAFALFVPFLMWPILVPPIALTVLVFWSLPDSIGSPTKYLHPLFVLFFIGLLLWPNYLALAIPAFPRVTVMRLFSVPLSLCVLLSFSVSLPFRKRIDQVNRANLLTWRLLEAFTILQIISVMFSANKAGSVNVLVNVLTTWVVCYLSSTFIMRKKGSAEQFGALLCAFAFLLSCLTFWEQLLHHLPWQGHVPSFLQINDPVVDRILAGTARQGKGHRDQATFTTSLGLSEFLALVIPFFFHFAFTGYKRFWSIIAFCSIPLVLAATLLTQARTGLLGSAVAMFAYPVGRVFLYWYNHRKSFIASVVLYLSPVGGLAALAIALVVPAVRIRLLGGGGEQLSNGGRTVQMHMGLPKVFSHPWGYGIGQGAETLGWTNAAGLLSIDSYPLRLALEYGILGLGLWVCMLGSGIWTGWRCLIGVKDPNREKMLLLPIIISLFTYFAMKINFAQEDNQPVIYALIGTAAAICQNATLRSASASPGCSRPKISEVPRPQRS